MAFEKINKKINEMSIGKKILTVFLFLLILIALILMANTKRIDVITYSEGNVVLCNETYINGVLQGDMCPQNKASIPTDIIGEWNQPLENDYESIISK